MALSDLLPPDLPSDRSGVSEGPSTEDLALAAPPSRRQVRNRRRRRGRGPLIAAAALIAAASAGAFVALQNGPERPSGDAETTAERATAPTADLDPAAQPQALDGDLAASASNASTGDPAADRSAAPTRIEQVSGRPQRAGSWPAFTYTLQAATDPGEPLAFPGAISGYSLIATDSTQAVISDARYFTAVSGLPVRTTTYDECRRYRFYTRWMTVDPQARVESTFVDEHVRTVQNRPVTGSSGWQSSYGCVQPAMRLVGSGGAPSRAVVLVETQVWQRR